MAAFIKHTSCDKCGSSDGRAVYQDDSSHCFVCEHTIPSEEFKEANQKKPSRVRSSIKKEENMEVKPSSKPALTPEENIEIKSETSVKAKGFRGIDDSIYAKFGVRHAFAEDTGEVIEQYYPCTQDGQLVGYKVREVPKNFYSKGRTGADCELFMQFRFNRGGKYVIITEGEVDALSAYQMLAQYAQRKGSIFETAVVSPTTGANSHKQIAGQFRFFDSFDNIIISYDNDKAGQTATEQLLKVLPKGKVKIMPMRYKDANEYLQEGAEEAFISDFYNAKKQVPVGVLASSNLYDRIIGQTAVAKIPFPPFMQKLNELFVGGMPLGHIVNIAADTGIGKTTLVNELIYYWIFNSPHTVGIVSMELDAGQYGEVLLSRHLEKKLALLESQYEKIAYLSTDRVV